MAGVESTTLYSPLDFGFEYQAGRAAAVFDVDETLIPTMGYAFIGFMARNYPSRLLFGPMSLWQARKIRPSDWRPVLRSAQMGLERPDYQAMFQEYAAVPRPDQIFIRGAEELAWHKANLHSVVLATGGFQVFAAPFLSAMQADHTIINENLYPMTVHGKSKPRHLSALFETEGLTPHEVYTDSLNDAPMVDGFSWKRVHWVVKDAANPPLQIQQALADTPQWSQIIERGTSHERLPESVRRYAGTVIRSAQVDERKRTFYQLQAAELRRQKNLVQRFMAAEDLEEFDWTELNTLREILAGAGLFLKENTETQTQIAQNVGADYGNRMKEMYAKLVSFNPDEPDPLSLLTLNEPSTKEFSRQRRGLGSSAMARSPRMGEIVRHL